VLSILRMRSMICISRRVTLSSAHVLPGRSQVRDNREGASMRRSVGKRATTQPAERRRAVNRGWRRRLRGGDRSSDLELGLSR
jgi:hypothetical protein